MTDRERLRELAEKATPGPWRLGDARDAVRAGPRQSSVFVAGAPHDPDAEYIAAASPDVILALLEERRVLREALTDIADWDAHNEDCATINPLTGRVTDKDCSCGWVEVADHAREAIGLEPLGYPQHRALQERTEATR